MLQGIFQWWFIEYIWISYTIGISTRINSWNNIGEQLSSAVGELLSQLHDKYGLKLININAFNLKKF